ncbi:hypothetical protein HII36_31880 [Nonomuraea sp. NN258]|uniref:DUF6069 family protein n=1 Tax=Nonomuraea antri TaxID=2730852 RepID=UPI001568B715|nr:DUF6069 family protein [Nonomuraea antri]NRQ36401.1 hypothetical protein [Nonomuraea antri]
MKGAPEVDTGRLWGGGLATALVAALVAWVCVLVTAVFPHAEVLTPESRGHTDVSGTLLYVFCAGMGALAATLILQIMVMLTPRPLAYFGWITGLVTAAFCVLPFTVEARAADQVATGLANLFVGLVILTLLPKVGHTAVRGADSAPPDPRDP